MRSTLHFYTPNDTPENGYTFVKFHIGGDTTKYNKEDLLYLRQRVSRLLRVPQQFVYLNGVEPSNSLLITFMIPEDVLYVLMEITDKEKADFSQVGVDYIQTKDEKIHLCDTLCKTHGEETHYVESENIRLHKKVRMQEMEIQKLQSSLVTVNKEVKEQKQKKNGFTNDDRIKCLELLVLLYEMRPLPDSANRPRQKVPSCKLLSSQFIMRRMLQKCRELGYDENVILQLLESISITIRETTKAALDDIQIGMNLQLQRMYRDNVLLQYQIQKLRFYMGLKPSDGVLSKREEFYLSHFPLEPPVHIGVTFPLDESSVHNFLTHLSKKIVNPERFKLQRNANLAQEDMEYIERNPEQLLLLIKFKEHLRTKQPIDLGNWLLHVLTPLENDALIKNAMEMMRNKVRIANTPLPTTIESAANYSKEPKMKPNGTKDGTNGTKHDVDSNRIFDEKEKIKNAEEIDSKLNDLKDMMMDLKNLMHLHTKNPFSGFSDSLDKHKWFDKEIESLFNSSVQGRL